MGQEMTVQLTEAGCFLGVGTVVGMIVLCSGEFLGVLREIALNSRRPEQAKETTYPALAFVSGLVHLVALFIFVGAVGGAVAALTTDYNRKIFYAQVGTLLRLGQEGPEAGAPAPTPAEPAKSLPAEAKAAPTAPTPVVPPPAMMKAPTPAGGAAEAPKPETPKPPVPK